MTGFDKTESAGGLIYNLASSSKSAVDAQVGDTAQDNIFTSEIIHSKFRTIAAVGTEKALTLASEVDIK